jgi:uncharacterized phage-associated protein
MKGPTMCSVHDAAAYILAKQGPMTAMKLQKLCYYAQAWSLVWEQQELFPEEFEAWANGPVVRELYDRHRGQFQVSTWPSGEPTNLTPDQAATVDAVLEAYGKLTARQLSELTHREFPWREARGSMPATERSSHVIGKAVMQDFYASLVTREDAEDI